MRMKRRLIVTAYTGNPLSGIMERHPRLRRHGDDPSALIAPYTAEIIHESWRVGSRAGETSYDIVRNYWMPEDPPAI